MPQQLETPVTPQSAPPPVIPEDDATAWDLTPAISPEDAAALAEANGESVVPAPVAPAPAPVAETEIIIAGKKFNNAKDAEAYANQLITGQAPASELEIYRKALLDAQRLGQPAPQLPQPQHQVPLITAEQFYENPTEALNNFAAQIETKTINKLTAQQQEQANYQKLWDNFYVRHPDLKDKDLLCRQLYQMADQAGEFTAVGSVTTGYDILATKVRKQLNDWGITAKPAEQLNPGPVQVGSGGGSGAAKPNVTTPAKPVDMSQHLNQLRRKRFAPQSFS